MRTIAFDLDGTLADTSADLLAAANACFETLGQGAPLDGGDSATAFRGGRAMLRLGSDRLGLGWGEAEIGRQYQALLGHYAAVIDRETRLYPGAAEALDRLRGAGMRLTICTNKPAGLADLLLARLGVRDRFAHLVGGDTLAVRKPDPAPLRAAIEGAGGTLARGCLIGDTAADRGAGRAAGVPVALVTFGPDGQGVAGLEPEALLHHFDDLDAVVARLLP
jgi:phosphoglycolate phosphatase